MNTTSKHNFTNSDFENLTSYDLLTWWKADFRSIKLFHIEICLGVAEAPPHQELASIFVHVICVFFAAVITVLYMSEVFFEKVFLTRPFKALFVTSDDSVHEWWFRWQLDRYRWTFFNFLSSLKCLNRDSNRNIIWSSQCSVWHGICLRPASCQKFSTNRRFQW